jgi:hypothetical protein
LEVYTCFSNLQTEQKANLSAVTIQTGIPGKMKITAMLVTAAETLGNQINQRIRKSVQKGIIAIVLQMVPSVPLFRQQQTILLQ